VCIQIRDEPSARAPLYLLFFSSRDPLEVSGRPADITGGTKYRARDHFLGDLLVSTQAVASRDRGTPDSSSRTLRQVGTLPKQIEAKLMMSHLKSSSGLRTSPPYNSRLPRHRLLWDRVWGSVRVLRAVQECIGEMPHSPMICT
jgi:hypothetical protein